MSYRKQILNTVVQGRYGGKKYNNLLKNKRNLNTNQKLFVSKTYSDEKDSCYPGEKQEDTERTHDFESEPFTENEILKFDVNVNPRQKSIFDMMDENIEIISDEKNAGKIFTEESIKENIRAKSIKETIQIEDTTDHNSTSKSSEDLGKKISDLEDYVVDLAIEIENMKNAQENIKKVISKISIELNNTKNKITR